MWRASRFAATEPRATWRIRSTCWSGSEARSTKSHKWLRDRSSFVYNGTNSRFPHRIGVAESWETERDVAQWGNFAGYCCLLPDAHDKSFRIDGTQVELCPRSFITAPTRSRES